MGDLILLGDVQGLADYALQQYVREEWTYVHVWGVVEKQGDQLILNTSGWEPAEERYWLDNTRREDAQVRLLMDDGQVLDLLDLPEDVATGTRVSVLSGEQDRKLEWHAIQEMGYAVPPSDAAVAEVQMTVGRWIWST
jgi:hypothetical protein